jgi:2,3-bisphosphoglycerate-dependent phosphoglycerate mutase
MPYWNSTIRSSIGEGNNVLVVAHGNSLRSIIKELNGMSEAGKN